MKKYDVLKKMALKGETIFLETEEQIDAAVAAVIDEAKAKKTDGYYEAQFKTLLALVVGATNYELNEKGTNYKSLELRLNLPVPKEYMKLEDYWLQVVEKYRSQNL